MQQAAQVADLLVFGQLKDEGGQIAGGEERVRQRRLGEQVRADVDRQEAVRGQLGPEREATDDDQRLQLGATAQNVGGGEPPVRGQARLTGEPGQRLVADDRRLVPAHRWSDSGTG